MGNSSLEANPRAVFLAGMLQRRADGQVSLGGRVVAFRGGRVVAVRPAGQDEGFADFMERSGRLRSDERKELSARAVADSTSLQELLLASGRLAEEQLATVQRSLWIDRLVAALRQAAAADGPHPTLEPDPNLPSNGEPRDIVPLLLDVLARLAGDADAAVVGGQLDSRVLWLATPYTDEARDWAGFGGLASPYTVRALLMRMPAAAARVAALSRLGVVRLEQPRAHSEPPRVGTGTLPPPPPRATLLPSDTPPSTTASSHDPLQQARGVRAPRLRLDPGADGQAIDPLPEVELRFAKKPVARDADPLLGIELRIADLEQTNATGEVRAEAWRQASQMWMERLASFPEATRALREASAAHPSNQQVLLDTAAHCQGLGKLDLADAYADGAVTEGSTPEQRARALFFFARLQRIRGDVEGSIDTLSRVIGETPQDPFTHVWAAMLLAERGSLEGAADHARAAAALQTAAEPERARALYAWAHGLLPEDPNTAAEYATLLEDVGRGRAAVAVLANAAQFNEDLDQRRRLVLAAAQQAEALARPDLAAELLLEAFDAEPHFDLVYGPLDEDLMAAGPVAHHIAVLEDIAAACPVEERASWLTRCAQRMAEHPDQQDEACWVLFAALQSNPAADEALDMLRQRASQGHELELLAHAMRMRIASCLPANVETATPLLEELASLAEEGLGNPHLAQAAWTQLTRVAGNRKDAAEHVERLTAVIEAGVESLAGLQGAHAAAQPEQRATAARAFADALPSLPDRWEQECALRVEAVGLDPSDTESARRVEVIHGLRGDSISLAMFLEERADQVTEPGERLRLLTRLSAVHARRDDPRAAATACTRLLSLDADNRCAIARLNRAARRLRDAQLLRHSMSLWMRTATSDSERARVLAVMTRFLELNGDFDACVSSAEAALQADPDSLDCAIIALRHAHRLSPDRALQLLMSVRAGLGDSRPILALAAQAAGAAGQAAQQETLIDNWQTLLPFDPEPQIMRLAQRAAGTDAAALDEAIASVLGDNLTAAGLKASRDACVVLCELGDPCAAALRLLQCLEADGRNAAHDSLQVLRWAREGGDTVLITQALEHQIRALPEAQRLEPLLELATHHGELADEVGESRALMRALTLAEGHPEVSARLVDILASQGDGPRLHTLLGMSLEHCEEPGQRRRLLLDLASVSATWLGDLEQAEFHVRSLIAESAGDADAVREALGALFAFGDRQWALTRCFAIADDSPPMVGGAAYLWTSATADQTLKDQGGALYIAARGATHFPGTGELLLTVERLALARSDVKTAMDTYRQLTDAAVGPHGRRALHYRAGRWLERAELPEQALDHYLRAFELAPGAGVAFKAIERITQQTERLAPLADVYEFLAQELREVDSKIDYLSRAAGLCLNGLEQSGRGFELLLQADAMDDKGSLAPRLHEALGKIRSEDAEQGRAAAERLCRVWTERADDLWDGEYKVRLLMALAELHATERQDNAAAAACLEQALTAVGSESLGPALQEDVLALQARLVPARDTPKLSQPATPPPQVPEPQAAAVPPPLPTGAELVTAAPLAHDAVTPVPAAITEDRPTPLSVSRAGTTPGVQAQILSAPTAPPPAVSAEDELRQRIEAGDMEAMQSLADGMRHEPTRRAEASHLYTRLLRAEPFRMGALRQLREVSVELGARALVTVTGQLLSCMDRELTVPAAAPMRRDLWQPGELSEVLSSGLSASTERVLTLTWDNSRALPRFRVPLSEHGVSPRDQLTPEHQGPVVDAYLDSMQLLSRAGTPLYLRGSDETAEVVATHPPAVLAPRESSRTEAELRFELGRSLWLARPEYVLVCVLAEHDARDLLDAVQAAFGPAGATASLSQEAKLLAASLWNTFPARDQSEATRLLSRPDARLDVSALRAMCSLAALRAGVFAAGDAAASLRSALRLDGHALPPEEAGSTDWESLMQESPAACEVVRAVLGDAYLSAATQQSA